MKFQKLVALLGLGTIVLDTNFFGNKKPFAKFDEEQLQKIEDALEEKDTSALEQKITEHETTISGLNTEKSGIENAVNQALQLNGLELPEGTTMADAVALLGTTCKTYGDSKSTHTIVQNDGVEKSDGTEEKSSNYAHNQVFDESKYTTLK